MTYKEDIRCPNQNSNFWTPCSLNIQYSDLLSKISMSLWTLTSAADPESLCARSRAGAALGRALHAREARPVPVRPGARVVLKRLKK